MMADFTARQAPEPELPARRTPPPPEPTEGVLWPKRQG